jgi:hypothetical protein
MAPAKSTKKKASAVGKTNANESMGDNCIPTGSRLRSRRYASKYLGVTVHTLAVWASTGRYNLPFVKVGRKAMYWTHNLEEFVRQRTKVF